jgi:hypothetical protein
MKRKVFTGLFLLVALVGMSTAQAAAWPSGATGKCNDGTYSYAKSHRGMCSKHHGVMTYKSM